MKEMWEAPRIAVQVFVPGEYATSICSHYTARVICAIPGSSKVEVGDGTSTAYGTEVDDNHGYAHGSCGSLSGSFDVNGGTGFEYRNGSIDYNRKIYDITLGDWLGGDNNGDGSYTVDDYKNYDDYNELGQFSGTFSEGGYKAQWYSTDGVLEYFHWGLAIIQHIFDDLNRPNHS